MISYDILKKIPEMLPIKVNTNTNTDTNTNTNTNTNTCNAKLELLPTNKPVTVIVSLLKPFLNLRINSRVIRYHLLMKHPIKSYI